ncbi:hypothetical protein [Halobaculum sp. P14]
MTDEAVFHVVCRECTAEELVATADEADAVVADHEAETGHDVDVARVE